MKNRKLLADTDELSEQDLSKLTGYEWSRLLIEQPQLANKCDLSKLGGTDWCYLLIAHPQFADKCDWSKLGGFDWSELLIFQPQFADKCDFRKLDEDDWRYLLREHPQFANKRREVIKMKNEIIIDGVKYIPASKKESIGGIKIVILQRGWVMIGRFEKEGTECKLHNASVIRVWGTTKGLGQLANEGKQKETILDKCYGLVQFDWLTVVAIIDCKEDIWANEL